MTKEKPTKLEVSFGKIWEGEEKIRFDPKDPKYSEVEELYLHGPHMFNNKKKTFHPVKNLGCLPKLKSLSIDHGGDFLTKGKSFFDKKIDLHKLKSLTMGYCNIPKGLKDLDQLEKLNIFSPNLSIYEKVSLGELPKLKELYLSHMESEQLPLSFNCPNLKEIGISCIRDLESIPENIMNYRTIEILNFGQTMLRRLPNWINELENLRELHLWNNAIEYIPNQIGQLKKLELLDLDHNGGQVERDEGFLRVLPEGLGEAENLKYLFAYGNRELAHLPESLTNLTKLKIYDFKDLPLTENSKKILERMPWAKPRPHKGAILSMLEKNKGDIGLSCGSE